MINSHTANTRIDRARHAVARGIRYQMGAGGTDVDFEFPTHTGFCDCSGFAAWVMGLNRAPKKERPFWIETTNIVNDARGKQKAFVRLSKPERGAFIVYGDRKVMGVHKEGHIGLIVDVLPGGRLMVIDCSSSKNGKTVESIREWDRTMLFLERGAIVVTLKQDVPK